MRRLPAALLSCIAATACSPTFNWRDVRAEPTPLVATLPCKPDKGARRVPMAGREVELQVIGCDAGGATFAVLFADLGGPGRAGEALAQWQQATALTMQATRQTASPFVPPGALALPQSQRVSATGRRADGSAVQGEAAYFARGNHVYQAVVYADAPRPEVTATFFQGLRFAP